MRPSLIMFLTMGVYCRISLYPITTRLRSKTGGQCASIVGEKMNLIAGSAAKAATCAHNSSSSARLSDGLRQAGAATGRARLAAASERAAQAVEGGSELGPALLSEAAFPRSLAAPLASAEFTGTLDVETSRGAREWMARAAWLLESAPKRMAGAFYAGVLAFTAWQIWEVAQAYMGMYQQFADEMGL